MMDTEQLAAEMRKGFEAVNQRFDTLRHGASTRFDTLETRIVERIEDASKKLVRVINGNCIELHQQITDLDKRFTGRFDSIDRRLELHSGILVPLVEWSNKFEGELVRLASQLADVQTRLAKLENPAA